MLEAGYDLKRADALSYSSWVDNLPFCAYGQYEKVDIDPRRGTLVDDVSKTRQMVSFRNELTGEWERCPYSFGVLGMSK